MTSVDELFKNSNQASSSKRKLEISHDPSEYYKSAKHSANGDATNGRGAHEATVEDEQDDDDVEAGPAPPPDDDEGDGDYGPGLEEDDEEGRFFGGGVDSSAAAALDYLDEREKEDKFVEEVYDVKWIRQLGVKLERSITKNQELRSKFEDDPAKFMASEADLDAQIKDLSILSEHPELYAEFASQGCVESLVGLLAHENTDIAIDAVEAISELIDEDVEATEEQWNVLVDAALEADLLGLLASNLTRLDEGQEADRTGVYNALSILESLASSTTTTVRVGTEKQITSWLLERIKRPETRIGQNKPYAAEVLSILLQSSPANSATLIEESDAVNTVLELLAPYRRRDPANDTEEEEFMENLFDALISLVDSPAGKDKFISAEGVELLLIMLREGKMTKSRALRVLSHATASSGGGEVCVKVVEKQGLKTLFGMFMKKLDSSTAEHLLSIFASMLRALPGDSAERIRLLAKFMEKEYEKIGKLIAIRRQHSTKLQNVEAQIRKEREALSKKEQGDMESEWFSRRLEAGLFVLQTVDTILAWLIAEDGGAKKRVVELLGERDEGLKDIKATLVDQMEGATDEGEEAKVFKEMLGTLVEFVQ